VQPAAVASYAVTPPYRGGGSWRGAPLMTVMTASAAIAAADRRGSSRCTSERPPTPYDPPTLGPLRCYATAAPPGTEYADHLAMPWHSRQWRRVVRRRPAARCPG